MAPFTAFTGLALVAALSPWLRATHAARTFEAEELEPAKPTKAPKEKKQHHHHHHEKKPKKEKKEKEVQEVSKDDIVKHHKHKEKDEPAKPPGYYNGREQNVWDGHCAVYDVDNYAPPTSEKCFIRLYKCSDWEGTFPIVNSNTGDAAWALSKECWKYGKYLHIWQVEVAQPAIRGGKGRYAQCNRADPYGILCGCGLNPERPDVLAKHCPAPEPWLHTAKAFGWRKKSFNDVGGVYQFSLPYKAKGEPDFKAAQDFVRRKGYKKHGPEDGDAPFQWKEIKHEKAIDIWECLNKHVNHDAGDLNERLARFQAMVLDGSAEGCEDVAGPADALRAQAAAAAKLGAEGEGGDR